MKTMTTTMKTNYENHKFSISENRRPIQKRNAGQLKSMNIKSTTIQYLIVAHLASITAAIHHGMKIKKGVSNP